MPSLPASICLPLNLGLLSVQLSVLDGKHPLISGGTQTARHIDDRHRQ